MASMASSFAFGTGEVTAAVDRQRKYPSGDWMTSEQWFETVELGARDAEIAAKVLREVREGLLASAVPAREDTSERLASLE